MEGSSTGESFDDWFGQIGGQEAQLETAHTELGHGTWDMDIRTVQLQCSHRSYTINVIIIIIMNCMCEHVWTQQFYLC